MIMVNEKLRKQGKPKKTAKEKAKDDGKPKYDWRYEKSINLKTGHLVLSDQTWDYKLWRTNKVLSNFPDTVLLANEMNMAYSIEEQMQYDFYYYTVRKSKDRFFKTPKDKSADFDLIQQYYKYNNERTREALRILSPTQIEQIRKRLEKGGVL